MSDVTQTPPNLRGRKRFKCRYQNAQLYYTEQELGGFQFNDSDQKLLIAASTAKVSTYSEFK